MARPPACPGLPTSRASRLSSRRPRRISAFVGLLVLAAMLAVGPASHQPSAPALSRTLWQKSWTGPHTEAGYRLNPLWSGNLWENWLVDGDFIRIDDTDETDRSGTGWQASTEPASETTAIRQVHLYNTPPSHRVMEIVPSDGDKVIVSQWVSPSDVSFGSFAFSIRALSTQGDARVVLQLVDGSRRVLATVGWSIVGSVPASTGTELWLDQRRKANYLGSELVGALSLSSLLQEFSIEPSRVDAIGVSFLAADGQHVVIDGAYLGPAPYAPVIDTIAKARRGPVGPTTDSPFHYLSPPERADGGQPEGPPGVSEPPGVSDRSASTLLLELEVSSSAVTQGEELQVSARLSHEGPQTVGPLTVQFEEPPGFGLMAKQPPEVTIPSLGPGESASIMWNVIGQRPHAVNFGRPWRYWVRVGDGAGTVAQAAGEIEVIDPRPGRIFYVLTEDLEPMDSAGYSTRFTGNRNAWLDPEEYQVQLIEKPVVMNRIAEQYGAKWSHYIAWPAVLGAEWAAEQSDTGEWDRVLEALRQSISSEASRSHQYAPHPHVDYDYRIPGFIQSYHEPTDGYWANHLEHGFAHQVKRLGEVEELNSRTGLLFDYISSLEALTHDGQGQIVSTRMGSFDFGADPRDQQKSIEAFRRVGLWASSDADGNIGRGASAPYGENLYFTRPDNINEPARDLTQLGIVQFPPTPQRPILYEAETEESANRKVDQAWEQFTEEGRVRPGVHGIVGFTHAMFMLGDGDWRSTSGGAFARLDKHLAYVHQRYAKTGAIEFATSDEMVRAWLDYYTPTLLAIRGPLEAERDGWLEYPVRLLGRDIPVGGRHRHEVAVKYPLFLRDQVRLVEVRRDGKIVARVTELPTAYNDIRFVVDRPGTYTLHAFAPERGQSEQMLQNPPSHVSAESHDPNPTEETENPVSNSLQGVVRD